MTVISQTIKDAIVQKVLNQPNKSLKEIAKQNNIGYSTLNKWLKQYRTSKATQINLKKKSNKSISRQERFQHILATAGLDDTALGLYCREKGLYSVQLSEWKDEIMSEDNEKKYEELLAENKLLKNENKQLKKDVQRKNRALAETTALLILKKKADAIWGDHEED